MNSDLNKKYKKPKQKLLTTTNPDTSTSGTSRNDCETKPKQPLCPLLAKDSEWVDILQTDSDPAKSLTNVSDEEEVLQLVECEDGPQMKPLAIMFPGLLDKDPQMLQGILNRAMSTTEVTRHLVDLGQKANFTFMKKADRLISRDKQWMESLTENSNSNGSVGSRLISGCSSFDYETDDALSQFELKRKKKNKDESQTESNKNLSSSQNTKPAKW